MTTRRWNRLGLVPLLALFATAGLGAQEREDPPEPPMEEVRQESEIKVTLAAVGESGVTGTATIRLEQPVEATEPETGDVTYDLAGLESGASYSVVIHQGTCEASDTHLADVGTVEADAEGRIQVTRPIESAGALAVLSRDYRPPPAEGEAERQEMSRPVRHLQLQRNGEPVACGNFEPAPDAG